MSGGVSWPQQADQTRLASIGRNPELAGTDLGEGHAELPAHVEHGIDEWEAAFLYGEFEGRGRVRLERRGRDRDRADQRPRAAFRSPGSELGLAPECQGATDVELAAGGARKFCLRSGSTSTPDLSGLSRGRRVHGAHHYP